MIPLKATSDGSSEGDGFSEYDGFTMALLFPE